MFFFLSGNNIVTIMTVLTDQHQLIHSYQIREMQEKQAFSPSQLKDGSF